MIYVNAKSITEAKEQLQKCINTVEYWYTENKLKVNAKKTQVMILGTKQKLSGINHDNFNIKFGDIQLKVVTEFKYLGLHLDEGLTWNKHCTKVLGKAGFKLHLMRRLNKLLPREIMIQIYKTYMMPILEYAATVWGYTSKENENKIQKVINLCARIISKDYDFINSRGAVLAKELGWNTFKERRDFLLSVLMFKCHDGTAPAYLSDKLNLHTDLNVRQSRHTDDSTYHVPRTNTKKAEAAFMVQGPTVWNRIPANIRNAPTLDKFKTAYKQEILGLQKKDIGVPLNTTRPN